MIELHEIRQQQNGLKGMLKNSSMILKKNRKPLKQSIKNGKLKPVGVKCNHALKQLNVIVGTN